MQEDQVDQAQATEEPTAETAGEGGDAGLAEAVDIQAAVSDGTAAEAEPEVPDDASQKIRAAQEHIDNLNMDKEREAAKRVM